MRLRLGYLFAFGLLLTVAAVLPAAAQTPPQQQVTAASGNQANAAATATLAGVEGKVLYLTGFEVTASGATAAAVVNVTVTGAVSGTLTYVFTAPAGATAAATPLVVQFPTPVRSLGPGQSITVTLPALGSGNTNAAVVAHGFYF